MQRSLTLRIAEWAGTCGECRTPFDAGDSIGFLKNTNQPVCAECWEIDGLPDGGLDRGHPYLAAMNWIRQHGTGRMGAYRKGDRVVVIFPCEYGASFSAEIMLPDLLEAAHRVTDLRDNGERDPKARRIALRSLGPDAPFGHPGAEAAAARYLATHPDDAA